MVSSACDASFIASFFIACREKMNVTASVAVNSNATAKTMITLRRSDNVLVMVPNTCCTKCKYMIFFRLSYQSSLIITKF